MNLSDSTSALPFLQEYASQILLGVVVMIIVSIVGLFINASICITIAYKKALQIPFGILCFNHCLNNLLIISLFAVWCLPIILIGPHSLFEGPLGIYLGQVAWYLWFTFVWSHLLLAVNRFLALVFPLLYNRKCNQRNTKIACALVWILGCGQFLFLNTNPRECFYTFDDRKLQWNFGDWTSNCSKLMQNMDALNVYVTLAVSICLDLITLCKLLSLTKNKILLRKKRKDIRFFIQSAIMGLSLLLLTLSFHLFPIWLNKPIHYFWLTTVAWVSHHTLDGIIVISFNSKMRKVLLEKILPTAVFMKYCSVQHVANIQVHNSRSPQWSMDKKVCPNGRCFFYGGQSPKVLTELY